MDTMSTPDVASVHARAVAYVEHAEGFANRIQDPWSSSNLERFDRMVANGRVAFDNAAREVQRLQCFGPAAAVDVLSLRQRLDAVRASL